MNKRYYGVKGQDGRTHLDRTKFFLGTCDFCGANADLRPYGPAGEEICYACARKDPQTTEKRMNQVIFGEGLDA